MFCLVVCLIVLFGCLFVCLLACLFVFFFYLVVCLFICLFVCLFVYVKLHAVEQVVVCSLCACMHRSKGAAVIYVQLQPPFGLDKRELGGDRRSRPDRKEKKNSGTALSELLDRAA